MLTQLSNLDAQAFSPGFSYGVFMEVAPANSVINPIVLARAPGYPSTSVSR
jgi:hypothetical protein